MIEVFNLDIIYSNLSFLLFLLLLLLLLPLGVEAVNPKKVLLLFASNWIYLILILF
jgi:hypothetical protein